MSRHVTNVDKHAYTQTPVAWYTWRIHMSTRICLHTCPSTSIHLSMHMSMHMPVRAPTHMSTLTPKHRSMHMFAHMSIQRLCTCLHTHLNTLPMGHVYWPGTCRRRRRSSGSGGCWRLARPSSERASCSSVQARRRWG